MSGDDDREDRPRLSWSELDKRRGKPRPSTPERRPRGAAAEALSRSAAQSYLKGLDSRLFKTGAPAAKLAAAVRDALGTPGLDDAARAYLEQVGPPREAALVAAFLDARDRTLQIAALAAWAEETAAGRAAPSVGLRAQLRTLAQGPDDEVAERAEAILAMRS